MTDYITKIRTTSGDKQMDYNALANLPQALKSPNKLTFTGAVDGEYDGSEEVTVNIPVSGGTDWTFFSQTPCRLSGSSIGSVRLVSSGTCDYRIYSDTVKDMDSTARTLHWMTEDHTNGCYKFTVTIGDNPPSSWYQIFFSMKFTGLEVGKAYKLYVDTTGLTPDSTGAGMHFGRFLLASVVNGSKSDLIISTTEVDHARLNSWQFVATTPDVLLEYYAGKEISELVSGYQVRFKDLYINSADAESGHTPIFNQSGTFTGELQFPEYTDKLHYESTPACSVYYSEAKSKLFTINGQEPDASGNIEIPVSRLQSRTMACFGDSITGDFQPPVDYPSVVAKLTGLQVYNLGMGGCRMSQHSDQYYDAFSMYRLADAVATGDFTLQEAAVGHTTNYAANRVATLKSIDWTKVDYVTLLFGTNDIQGGMPLDNADDPKDVTAYLGAARYSLETLWSRYPHLRILLLTPIYRYWDNERVDSDEKMFGNKHFYEYGNVLLQLAKDYKTPALDLYYTLGINKYNRGQYFPIGDGTHPNDLGRTLLGEKIAGKLLSEF
ncbi:SGNH/GDSL hydrolase family protein [Clostridium sp. D33t1_170424_F3]|uniref:SGNH/GDSL hydrolase family protein n=1 Tax=Clostridium sp. D33t1_170424_F3 TaxID=2787099 RepID=UPI0018AC32BE|nr:SGNH/GDSL hydrolase family protein [Clostridium sp. D33t1_170424_F3]